MMAGRCPDAPLPELHIFRGDNFILSFFLPNATDAPLPERQIFCGDKFVLSFFRRNATGFPLFDEGEIRRLIQLHGGTVYDDFQDLLLAEGTSQSVYLIADTYCRTPQYLSALSLSVPCVHVDWITESIKKKECVEFRRHMLPAGEAVGPDGGLRVFKWKSSEKWSDEEPTLMTGKKIWVHTSKHSMLAMDFLRLWPFILGNLDAKVILDDQVPEGEHALAQWINDGGIDILLTDAWCEPAIARAVKTSANAAVVGREWVIEALITGECPDPSDDRYKP